jgi:hypothetical protein
MEINDVTEKRSETAARESPSTQNSLNCIVVVVLQRPTAQEELSTA